MASHTDLPSGSLLQVFPPGKDQGQTSIDIVAIHGLGTTSPVTWEARAAEEVGGTAGSTVNWLCDPHMLPNVVPSARIYTFMWNSNYYENAPVARIQDVASVLMSKLKSQRDKDNTHARPLIFIASCFGGLIVTKALENAHVNRREYQQLIVATTGVIFLGSPLQGTSAGTAAQWRAMLAGILNRGPSQTLLGDLDGSTKELRDTTDRFLIMIRTPPMQTMTMCYWETKETDLSKAVLPEWMLISFTSRKMILVEEDSACFLGHPKQHLDARHAMMNKFRGPEDPNFELVSDKIREMVGEAKRIALAQREAVHIHNEHFMVSRLVNTLFTGRKEEIETLQQSLCPSRSTGPQIVSPRIYVIHGMGGAGKSEVALKFAYDNRAEFWGVFWIDARSETSLDRGFSAIAKRCGLQDQNSDDARSWLQDSSHTWLLILDNADDPSLDYAKFIPPGPKGSVLITSRVKKCATLQTAGKDQYDCLNEETAVELLLKACGIDVDSFGAYTHKAQTIVDLLGGHALAIIQAGVVIQRGICDLNDYKHIFARQRLRLLKVHPHQAKSEYGDVYATFEVTATYLSNRRDRTAKDAMTLLNCYAFMHFTNFPEKTFGEAWRNSSRWSREWQRDSKQSIEDLSPWHVSQLPSFMRESTPEDLDHISLHQAQSLLDSLSLIIYDVPARSTRMHPVTQMWARDRLRDDEESIRARLGSLAVLCLSIKSPYEPDASWVQLQPHIEVMDMAPPRKYLQSNKVDLHQSFFRLSWVLRHLRADRAAIKMFRASFIEGDQSWTQSEYSQDIQYLYSRCLINCGDLIQGVEVLEQVVKTKETLSQEHPHRLSSQHALAKAYLDTRETAKAIELLEHVVGIQGKMLSQEHPARLASQHELARAYLARGETTKAMKILELVVERQKMLNPKHPARLDSQLELARAYLKIGKIYQAIDLLEQVDKFREKTLGPEHPDRLDSQQELAKAYLVIDDVDDSNSSETASITSSRASESSKSSVSTQSSSNSALAAALDEIMAIFMSDEGLRYLFDEAFIKQDQDKVTRNTVRLLRWLGRRLVLAANTPIEKEAAKFFLSRRHDRAIIGKIAQKVTSNTWTEERQDQREEEHQQQEAMKQERLEVYLGELTKAPPENLRIEETPMFTNAKKALKDGESDAATESEDEDKDKVEPVQINVDAVKLFLKLSDAFARFKEEFEDFVNPFRSETMWTKTLWNGGERVRFELSSVVPRLTSIDRLKLATERKLGMPILWWPLKQPKKHLPSNKVRIVWICGCGDETYVDVSCAKARRYRQMCDTKPMRVTAGETPMLPTHSASPTGSGAAGGFTGWTSALMEKTIGKLRQRRTRKEDGCPMSEGSEQTTTVVPDPTPNTKHVHWCVDSAPGRTFLHHICIEQKKGTDFFDELCRSYKKLRGWRWYLSMTTCTEIRLVKLSRVYSEEEEAVVCTWKDDVLPNLSNQNEYTYILKPPDLEKETHILRAERALIDHYHGYKSCHMTDHINQLIVGIPHRVTGTKLGLKGYGIWARQGWTLPRLATFALLTQGWAILFVVFWLLYHPGDLQNAFSPGYYSLGWGGYFVLKQCKDQLTRLFMQ